MSNHRVASGLIYVQEEISDARLRCDELKNYIAHVMELIEDSDKKDHFYAVAGDMIQAIPQTVMLLEKALQASALAVNKIDYDELKLSLRPEKVEELERVLDRVRIKMPKRV
jgi:uncharacterized protein (DUF3084 family)